MYNIKLSSLKLIPKPYTITHTETKIKNSVSVENVKKRQQHHQLERRLEGLQDVPSPVLVVVLRRLQPVLASRGGQAAPLPVRDQRPQVPPGRERGGSQGRRGQPGWRARPAAAGAAGAGAESGALDRDLSGAAAEGAGRDRRAAEDLCALAAAQVQVLPGPARQAVGAAPGGARPQGGQGQEQQEEGELLKENCLIKFPNRFCLQTALPSSPWHASPPGQCSSPSSVPLGTNQALLQLGVTTGIALVFALLKQNWSTKVRVILN